MNDKTEIAFSKHINRLEKDIAERAREWPEPRCGHHLALDKDDLKKIAKANGRAALEEAFHAVPEDIRRAITSADKAALKQVASNANPS